MEDSHLLVRHLPPKIPSATPAVIATATVAFAVGVAIAFGARAPIAATRGANSNARSFSVSASVVDDAMAFGVISDRFLELLVLLRAPALAQLSQQSRDFGACER